MAQAIAKKNSKKRQPIKSKLPSSSRPKKTAKKQPKKVTLALTRKKSLQITFNVKTTKIKKRPVKKYSRKILPLAMIIVGIMGLGYVGWQVTHQPVIHAEPQIVVPKVQAAPISSKQSMVASDATSLQIPDIGVNAPVSIVGKRRDGSMEVPKDAKIVGQYRYAPTPGENGPAILVGHVDSETGPAVFWKLRKLQPGQIITIKRVDGTTVTFKVDKVEDYKQDNFPTESVYGNIDYPGLRLITCSGQFNHVTRQYSSNTVVYASIVQ